MIKSRLKSLLSNRFFYYGIVSFFILSIFCIHFLIQHTFVPIQKETLTNARKEKLKEIAGIVINRLNFYHLQVVRGDLALPEAQEAAKKEIEFIRYGDEALNYFWIHDEEGVTVMHPFFKDHLNKNQKNLQSTDGINFIKEMNKMVKEKGEGFLTYSWKRRYESDSGTQKISYVKGFKPWGWVIGTGFYYADIENKVNEESTKLTSTLQIILLMVSIPFIIVVFLIGVRDRLMGTEIELKTKELARLAMVADRTHSGVLIMNMDGEIEWVNKSFTNITGYSLNEAKGKKPSDFLNGINTDPNVICDMRKALRNRQRVCVELCNYHKNGEELWLNIEVVPIVDKNNLVVNHIAIEQDITQRIKSEKEKSDMRKKLIHSDKLASIGELAAGVGHEINNPLAIVQGNLDMLAKEYSEQEHFKIRFEKITSAMERIRGIVKGLRSFARNDSEEHEIVNVHESISDTVSLIETIFDKENIKINKNFSSSRPNVIVNQGRFQQVIMNLLTNSKDALEGKGGKIDIITKDIDGQISIKMVDNGCGIKPENMDKIFQAFHTTKAIGKGTGLGLSIVSSIIQSFEGTITVKSKVNVGTEFEILLPCADSVLEIHKKQEKVNEKTPLSYKGKVLVVDDEEDIREILKTQLEDIGFVVDEAADGKIALELVKEQKYLMVFTDLKMPNMRGDEFIEKVRNELKDNIPIVTVTGCQMNEEKDKTSNIINELGSGLIFKPFKREDIVKAINEVVEKMFKKAS